MYMFASNPLQPLIDVFEAVLKFFHDNVGLEWGLSIVFLTLIVRICLLPLTLRQFKSMQSMARHQPEMKRLQTKYKGDKDRLNQELMKFYKENKINPLASCLPLVAQIPVFISLFYMLRKDLRVDICKYVNINGERMLNPPDKPLACPDHGAADFLFIPNLTTKAHGGVLITLIILYVGSQLISTIMSTVSADNKQKYIMYALPFFFVTFVFRFPAGLLLYWITTNLWTIAQQMIVRRRLGPLKPPKEPGDDDGSTPTGSSGGPGGLLKSLGLPGGGGGGGEPAVAGLGNGSTPGPTKAPPAPPRKKKKKSGRRR